MIEELKLHPFDSRKGDKHKDEWLTPPEILKALGSFDLDPCSPINRPWPTAKEHYTIEDNGLLRAWRGRVWLNPPYGNAVGDWLALMSIHGRGTALIFARTDTTAFFDYVWNKATGILFLQGRLHFHHVDGSRATANAGAPSCLIAYGEEDYRILKESKLAGRLVRLNQ